MKLPSTTYQLLSQVSDLTDSQVRSLFFQMAGWLEKEETFRESLQCLLPTIKR